MARTKYPKNQFARDLADGTVALPEGEAKEAFDKCSALKGEVGLRFQVKHRPLFNEAYEQHLSEHPELKN